MGLARSGEVADAALMARAETQAVMTASRSGIKRWIRYRDDIFVIASDRSQTVPLLRTFKNNCDYFRITVDSIDNDTADFLNVTVIKDVKKGRYITKPLFKDTHLVGALDPTSAHPSHIHGSWPAAMVRSMGDLATHDVDALRAKDYIISKFFITTTIALDISMFQPPAR